MLQMSPEIPLKYKRRKVSAIRQFPRGCGPNAVKLSLKPGEETSSPVGLQNGKVISVDKALTPFNVAEETIALSPHALVEAWDAILTKSLIREIEEPPISLTSATPEKVQITKPEVQQILENCDILENKVKINIEMEKLDVHLETEIKDVLENHLESNPEMAKLEVQQVMEETAGPLKFQNMHCYSKVYGPARRRIVSAIRQFPSGCGPDANIILKDNNQPVFTLPTSLNDKGLMGKKIDEASKHLLGDDCVSVLDGEILSGKLRKNDDKGLVQENDQVIDSDSVVTPPIVSPKSKIFYGEKKPILQQQEMAGGYALVAGTKNMYHSDENMHLTKRSVRPDVSSRVVDAENSSNHEKSILKKAVVVDESIKVSSHEKVGTFDRKIEVTKGKEIVHDKNDLVRSNSGKNFKVQGTSGHALIKSSQKSGLDGKSALKSRSNEFLARSSSDKRLESCKVVQAVENFQDKAYDSKSSLLIGKSQYGIKRLDEKCIPLMEKTIGKENENNLTNSKKRKFSSELPHKDFIPGDSDDSLAAIGERMIIQALMSADNCPWRNPRKRSAVSLDCIPKSKVRKEKGYADKTPTSKDIVLYQQKRKGLIADDDNGLSITMTPCARPGSSLKGGDNEEVNIRHKVKRALRLFQLICRKLLQGEESRSKKLGKTNRIDLQAASILKDNGEWVNSGEPILGHVPGVEIGDEFHFRVELSIVGLHRPFQGGIDSTKKHGILLATSIVASGGYKDDMDSSDVLIYSGAGGTSAVGGEKQVGDQKLERGNLALKNSIDTQTPVRVIHGFKEKGNDPYDTKGKLVSTFTYDGLYKVESYWQEVGNHGFNVFRFQLRRIAGQPELALKELRRSAKLKIREGLRVKDISQGKEKMPISVVNTIDSDQPMPFKYITRSIYPSSYAKTPPKGCNCTDGCSDSEKCACAVKNGGEIPFNFNGAIVQAKPLIYECGPSCKCSPSCHNRVSQRGIRIQLEIFKTRGRGWGVRALKSIPSGSFICEYIGELLQDCDAEQRTNDEYLFDIGHNYDDRSLWEDLPNLIPGLHSSSECDTVESVGFTIDAAEYGNVGRFINHSCSPNLYAQNVLYDHDDKRMPHIMFFAVDNIPPLQELTYHYNYTIDQVRDSEGNIKQKACFCGSPECCGRLY